MVAVVIGAAVFRQVVEQIPNRLQVHGVDLGSAMAAAPEEPALLELLQMERAGRRRQLTVPGDGAGGETVRPALYQQAEDVEPTFLGEGAEHLQGLGSRLGSRFHISNNIEIRTESQLFPANPVPAGTGQPAPGPPGPIKVVLCPRPADAS